MLKEVSIIINYPHSTSEARMGHDSLEILGNLLIMAEKIQDEADEIDLGETSKCNDENTQDKEWDSQSTPFMSKTEETKPNKHKSKIFKCWTQNSIKMLSNLFDGISIWFIEEKYTLLEWVDILQRAYLLIAIPQNTIVTIPERPKPYYKWLNIPLTNENNYFTD